MYCVNHQGKWSLEMPDNGKRNSEVRNIASSITMRMNKEAIKDIKCHKVQTHSPYNYHVREGMQRIIMYIYTIYNIRIYTFVCTSDCAIALAMKFIVCNRSLK